MEAFTVMFAINWSERNMLSSAKLEDGYRDAILPRDCGDNENEARQNPVMVPAIKTLNTSGVFRTSTNLLVNKDSMGVSCRLAVQLKIDHEYVYEGR